MSDKLMKRIKFALVVHILAMMMSMALAVVGKDVPGLMTTAFLMFILNLILFFQMLSEVERNDSK